MLLEQVESVISFPANRIYASESNIFKCYCGFKEAIDFWSGVFWMILFFFLTVWI